VSTLAQDRADARSGDPGSTPGWIARQWARPFRQHAAAVAVVLLALMPLLGTSRLFHVDEGATLAQAELLARGDGWKYEQPRTDLDPSDRWSPLWPSDGEGSAPLDKHPTYSLLLTVPMRTLGATGVVLMSLLGTWTAAVLAALIARRLGAGLDRPVLWVTAVVSPLFLYGYVAVAHTLGAAVAGAAALAALRGIERRSVGRGVALGLLVVLGILLRSEAALFGAALGLGLLAVAVRTRRPHVAVLSAVAFAATVCGYVLEPWLTTRLISNAQPFGTYGATDSSAPYLIDRLMPTSITLVLPGYEALGGIGGMLSVIAAVAAAAAGWVARRRPQDGPGIRLFAIVAATAAVARLFAGAGVVPGLLVAFPLIVPGLLLVRRDLLRKSTTVLLGVTYLVFVGAVLATQYRLAGSGEWGFRYAILGLPLLVPVVVAGLASARDRLDPPTRRTAAVSVVVLSAATAVLAAGSLVLPQRGSAELVSDIASVREQATRPVVLTVDHTVPRFAWERVLAGESWLRVPEYEIPEVLPALVEDGGDVIFVSEAVDDQLPLLERTHTVILRAPLQLSTDREVVLLRPR
jgi:hypothetical protein